MTTRGRGMSARIRGLLQTEGAFPERSNVRSVFALPCERFKSMILLNKLYKNRYVLTRSQAHTVFHLVLAT
jgi:hypothetical protein